MNKLFIVFVLIFAVVVLMFAAIRLSSRTQYSEIDLEMVKNEISQDSLNDHWININYDCDYKVFYMGDICLVHIYQYLQGVQGLAIQRYYQFRNRHWEFVRELECMYECEQIGKNLFHSFSNKGAPQYENIRYESVMRCDSFEMKPIFEYDGVDYTDYLFNKYINGAVDYFNKYIGDTICDDNEVFDIEVVDNVLKSYKLKHTIKTLVGFDTVKDDLQTIDMVTVKKIICN